MILAITGGRFDKDGKELTPPPDQIAAFIKLVIQLKPTHMRHGAAKGTDTKVAEFVSWAQAVTPIKSLRDLIITPFPISPEDGKTKTSPKKRNIRMLDTPPSVDVLVAFPGGSGTAHCVEVALRMGIEVWQWKAGTGRFERISTGGHT